MLPTLRKINRLDNFLSTHHFNWHNPMASVISCNLKSVALGSCPKVPQVASNPQVNLIGLMVLHGPCKKISLNLTQN